MKPKWTAQQIEILVASYFNYRTNVVVPNVSWGLGLRYEADVVVLRPSDFGEEVEIKVSAADLRADQRKHQCHDWRYFRKLWFAVPFELRDAPEIPERAGVLVARRSSYSMALGRYGFEDQGHPGDTGWRPELQVYRVAKPRQDALKFSAQQRQKLMALGCMRIFDLKQSLDSRLHDLEHWRQKAKESK